jgi:microcystin-dependent protein
MSTFTTSLKIQEIANGDQSGVWGTTTNTNWTLIEQAVAGVQTITMSNADYTLTNLNGVSDEARNMVLVVQGTNSAIRKVIAPLNQPKMYVVSNQTTGGYAITIGASTGAYITIPNGVTAQVYTDGTNFYSAQTGSAGDFVVNGNLTAAGVTDTGALSAASLSVSGAAAFSTSPTAPTPTFGDNTTKVSTTAFVQSAVGGVNSVISGTIQMWPTASAPSGYLLCDGSAVSRTTYSALFAVIGTTFGAGDTTTTFNLPDYRGRVAMGVSGSYALASTGGSADAVVVSHTHTASVTDPGHSHTLTSNVAAFAGGSSSGANNSYNINFPGVTTNSATTGISVSNSSTGVSGTNANLQPYLAINFIIKT